MDRLGLRLQVGVGASRWLRVAQPQLKSRYMLMDNVIELYRPIRKLKRRQGDIDAVVRQEDLERLILLRRRAHEAVQEWKALQDRLLWMLKDGLPVEPGIHAARAVPTRKRPYRVKGCEYYRLSVR